MKRYCNSWRVTNLLVIVLTVNNSAESIENVHTWLLRPGTNFRPVLQCILHSSRGVDNARDDAFPLPGIYLPKEARFGHLET